MRTPVAIAMLSIALLPSVASAGKPDVWKYYLKSDTYVCRGLLEVDTMDALVRAGRVDVAMKTLYCAQLPAKEKCCTCPTKASRTCIWA